MGHGKIMAIYIAPTAGAPMEFLARARAIAGKGLEGDRYYKKLGTYSNNPGSGREVTLVESEAIEALKRECSVDLDTALARRNLVTARVALNHWVERKFRIGGVILRGTRLCQPCSHLERLTRPGVLRGLIRRGGLRAEIITGGTICVGDEILTLDD
jgi:MOSC domain-containing protein YiiM